MANPTPNAGQVAAAAAAALEAAAEAGDDAQVAPISRLYLHYISLYLPIWREMTPRWRCPCWS